MKKINKMLLIAILIAFASQFHISYYVDGFIITLSIIILPIALFFNKDLNYLHTCFLVALISPLFRSIIEFSLNNDIFYTLSITYPDIIFYITYGFVFQIYSRKEKYHSKINFFITIFIADFTSNTMEILTRVNLSNFHIKTFKVLILIAFIRMIIVISIISIIEYYQLFLKKEEHNKRYQELILLNAYFKSEIYFMNKNMIQIEKVMKKSYDAQKTAIKYGYNDLQVTLLDISKDIHEIKKDYSMAISGLETIKSKDYQITDIYLNDIFKILKCHLMDHDKWYDFYIHFNSDKNILLKKHFFFTSILRNLINNAIEAINKNVAHIYIETKIQNNMFTCIVTDNGSGIKEKNLPYIFNSGFSNKYDSISGFSQRGLGLTFVKDLVEKEYKGTITVKSIINKETSFIINIPINNIRKD